MARTRFPTSFLILIALNLVLVTDAKFAAEKFSLEEDIGEAIEVLFGEDANDDFTEFMHTCPKAKVALRNAEACLMPLNLTYERFTDLKHKRSSDYLKKEKICSDIMQSVSRCARPTIDAINGCANDRSLYETMEIVYKAVENSGKYLCSPFNMRLPGLLEGFPECFVRRPGRQMAKCFPGYGRSRDYLTYRVGHNFFDSSNCRLFSEQADCAVKSLSHCAKEDRVSFKDAPAFRSFVDSFFEEVCGSEYQLSPSTDGTSSIAFSWLLLVLSQFLIKFW